MRVSDLARKLGLKTDDLRPLLAEFKVAASAKEIETTRALEIFETLKNRGVSAATAAPEEEEREVMGFMFDDEPTGFLIEEEITEEVVVVETEAESAVILEEKIEVEMEMEVEAEEALAPAPAAPTPPPAAEPAAFVPHAPAAAATPARSTADREAARARWAAAKKASEKLLTKQVKKIEKEKIKRLSKEEELRERALVAAATHTRAAAKGEIEVGEAISVRELAERMGVSPIKVVGEMFKNGIMANLNQTIDFDTAAILGEAFGAKIVRDTSSVSIADILKGNIESLLADDRENLSPRPPIVAVMGHVDHGKTTLLDAIRKANVAAGESGGITQHIGAYQVEHDGRKITFLDTPGHEAFTAMRARGARATDIAILVVAADDGMKPQTLEALSHAREAGVPIIVAITKIDKEGANLDRVKGELAEHELVATDWGGKTEVVPVSAPQNRGIAELLEIILLTNDVEPVLANPARPAVGTVIESHLDKSLGPVATVLVNTGTLRTGEDFVIGPVVGRVKRMLDWNGKNLKEAVPGTPVQLAGLSALPTRGVGEILQVMPSAAVAREKADELQKVLDLQARQKSNGIGQFVNLIKTGSLKELKIVLKADVEGSLEAIRSSLEKMTNPEVRPKIIFAGVGDLTETDVLMAEAAGGLVLAFHVKTPPHVDKLAEREGITIRQHTIIYKLLEEVEKLLTGLLDPEEVEVEIGTLEIRGVFLVKENEQIVGGIVRSGRMVNGATIRVVRAGEVVGEGRVTSLKHEKETVSEAKEGHECGLKVSVKKCRIAEGDILQAYKVEKRKREL